VVLALGDAKLGQLLAVASEGGADRVIIGATADKASLLGLEYLQADVLGQPLRYLAATQGRVLSGGAHVAAR
jgi:hypothetical protein